MNPLARRFVKTAFGFLILGLLLGGGMLVRRELYGRWPDPYLVSAHTHLMFVGFVMFMILGVAMWLFPKPPPADRRYRESLISTVYWLLLSGTLLRVSGEVLQSGNRATLLSVVVTAAAMAQLAALGRYVWTMWTRIRSTTDYKTHRVERPSLRKERP